MRASQASGAHVMVSSGHALATGAALDVLRRGGNAVDAAVCAALVLCVVCPYACSLAGDAYLLIRDPATGAMLGLNGTGAAPTAATHDRFADAIPRTGTQAATVPGLVAALADALDRLGTRPWAELLAPAIALARGGFPVHPYFRANIADREALLARDARMAALFLPDGAPLAVDSLFVQPRLAESLERLAAEGVEGFYRGAQGADLAAASQAEGGLLTAGDMAAHASLWQEPLSAPFYGHDVWTMPPNSFGPTLLFQLLALEQAEVDQIDPASADFVLSGYAARRDAYKAAARLIGEPSLCEAPLRQLLAQTIAGAPPRSAVLPAEATDRCTTNVVVCDENGLSVSLIESISTPFGAGVMLGDSGIVLNNRLGGFSIDPQSLNVIAPGKRPAHTLAPCLVTKGGALAMALGTPGTVGQTCTMAQVLARILACGQDAVEAVSAPRWSADFQSRLIVEDCMDQAVRDGVTAGQADARVERTGWISFGSIKLAMRDGLGWRGVADARRSAMAAGY